MGSLSPTLDAETLEPSSRAGSVLPARALVVTLGLHPDLSRVGERAVLAGAGPATISRAEPSFLDAAGRSTGPLQDPHVSRAPLRLTPEGQGIRIDASEVRGGIALDGAAVSDMAFVDADALERGVCIGLAGTVLVVLRRTALERRARGEHGLEGASDEVDAIRAGIEIAATHADPVLILGESGTGKELVAAAIHRSSRRSAGPFVAVNVAALTPSTAVAELFGHTRGAFTGADGAHEGLFGRADGGTLFLDEIGDAPTQVQPMLLRALESGEITPVGGRSARRVDVRVIAATDQDVREAAAHGEFRLPLLHRLASQELVLAPLRARRQDVLPLLVRFLLAERPDADPSRIPFDLATSLVIARAWPGNVRELRNVARALAREGPEAMSRVAMPSATTSRAAESAAAGPPAAGPDASDAEVVAALRRNEFRIGATARELGIARNTLYKRMQQCEGLRRARDVAQDEIETVWTEVQGDLDRAAARLEVSGRALLLRMRELGLSLGDA